MVKGKLSFIHTQILLVFGWLFLSAGFLLMLYFFVDKNASLNSNLMIGGFALSMLGSACIIGFIVSIYHLEIVHQCIILKKEFSTRKISASEIESIDLLVCNGWKIGFKLILTSGESIFIEDVNYRNIGEIRDCLQNQFSSKIIPIINPTAIVSHNWEDNSSVQFSNNPLLCSNGILFCIIVVFLAIVTATYFSDLSLPLVLVDLYFITIFYLGMGFQMFYFTFSANELIIKNHIWFFYKKNYSLDEILAVHFDAFAARGESGLKIILKNYKNKCFVASSLRKKTWKALFAYFNSRGIPEINPGLKDKFLS